MIMDPQPGNGRAARPSSAKIDVRSIAVDLADLELPAEMPTLDDLAVAAAHVYERFVRTWHRRQLLRLAPAAGAGLLGLALGACAPSGPVASQATPNAAPGQSGAIPTGWDQLVAAAQKEGKVVVSGPPAPDARTK